MSKVLYIEYKDGSTLVNPYRVRLASNPDNPPQYGVKRVDTGEIIFENGTTVDNLSTGIFSREFDPVKNVVYDVSWEILATSNAVPQYITQQVGPFVDFTSIRSVADYKGNFKQGEIATLMLKITDFDGEPVSAQTISLTVRNSNGGVEFTKVPEFVIKGFYVYEWYVDPGQNLGTYTVSWDFVVDGSSLNELQEITLAADDGNFSAYYSGRLFMLRTALENYIRPAMRIPAYFEQAKPSVDNIKYRFSFDKWNQTPGCKIYRNKQIVKSGILVDYFRGEIIFDEEQLPQDVIHADYNFRWFTEEQLNSFLVNAINIYNHFPPFSHYGIATLPIIAEPGIILKAAVDAIREQIGELMYQEPQMVFGGPEEAKNIRADMETLKKNYEEEWKLIFAQKKFGPYPKIMAISVPEFTLPGGRSRWFRNMFSTNI